jgi:phosphoglycolate phosphatase
MATLRALLFDKDGTLVDFAATWNGATGAVIETLSAGDERLAARLAEIVHFDRGAATLLPSSPFIGGSLAELVLDWADALGVPPDGAFDDRLKGLFHETALLAAVPIGDPAALLGELKDQGYRLGLITNDSEAGARAQSEKLGFAHHFDAILGYDSGHGRKPEPGPVLEFMRRFDLRPDETALIGDTLHDLDAARAAGAVAIGVASGFLSAERLAPHADHVVGSIMELPALLAARTSATAG